MFALIDCNNFYASCERLFRPDLRDKPIVILSNNDGCVIARSNEAKALGVKMGEPFFKIKILVKQHHIHVFSSNYVLYGDLSNRVMALIKTAWPSVEIYSIDEAFLDLSTLSKSNHTSFCADLQKWILKATGMPVSIGIGPTKTLAKIANHLCKKELKIPVFNITYQTYWLERIPIGDVWGIGRQWQKKLTSQGINTASDLAQLNPHMIKKKYNVLLMRTIMELQGTSCIGLEALTSKQTILSSKSFGEMQTDIFILGQALSAHCARVCEKARAQQLVAQGLYIFIRSNSHRQDLKQYASSMMYRLVTPTNDTRVITRTAKYCLEKLYQMGIYYKKVGVMLIDLIDQSQCQLDLFNQYCEKSNEKNKKVMALIDNINHRFGTHTLKLAAEGYSKPWAMRSEKRSPCYTTRWADLLIVRNDT